MTLLFEQADGSATSRAWVTAIAPTRAELDESIAELDLPDAVVGHALDPNERPRVKSFDGTTFLVLRAPFFEDGTSALSFDTAPLAIVAGPRGGLITCTRDCPTVRALADYATSTPSVDPRRVVLRAVELTVEAYLEQLDAIERAVDATEKELSASLENRGVLALLAYQKSLVHFGAALESMAVVLDRLPKDVATADETWLADIRVELRQALETANLQRNVLSEMMDAFASIISNNLNVVMKFLAAVTMILTIPILVATFYGMNVALPGQASAHAFASAIAASVVLSLVVAVVFRRRGWL